MIDTDLLRRLGWSEELIRSVNDIAEPMRENAASHIADMPEVLHSSSGTTAYAEAAIDNAARGYTVQLGAIHKGASKTKVARSR